MGDDCDFVAFDFGFWLSLLVTLGTTASYLPQHYKILSKKSSEGLSSWYILLGGISSFSTIANSTLLNLRRFQCCQKIPFGNCISGLMRFFQIFFQWSCFFLIILLFLIFFPRNQKYVPLDSLPVNGREVMTAQWKKALLVGLALLLYLLMIVFISIVLVSCSGPTSPFTQNFAKLMGVLSLSLSLVMFIPQIWRTLHLKEVGALSIPGMCIQTPGSFVFCVAIILDPKSHWSTWFPTFVSGCLQGVLLILCIKYDRRRRRRERAVGPEPFGRIKTPL